MCSLDYGYGISNQVMDFQGSDEKIKTAIKVTNFVQTKVYRVFLDVKFYECYFC